MNLRRTGWGFGAWTLVGLFWSVPSPVEAAPLDYGFVSGTATISASTASGPVLGSTMIALDGAFVRFDDASPNPLLDGELIDFLITASASGVILLSSPWGGASSFTIESAILFPDVGYATTNGDLTAPFTYEVDAGPVAISATYDAGGGSTPVSSTSPTLSATVQTDTVVFGVLGLTLFTLDGASFGEPEDLQVKADILWFGQVPEPSTGLLLGLGIAGLAARRRGESLFR